VFFQSKNETELQELKWYNRGRGRRWMRIFLKVVPGSSLIAFTRTHSLTHSQTQHFTHSNNSLYKSIMPVNHFSVDQFNENKIEATEIFLPTLHPFIPITSRDAFLLVPV
jgi:hypothetical protein